MVSWTQVEFSTKSKKHTPDPRKVRLGINHCFPVSELLYEHYAEAMLYELGFELCPRRSQEVRGSLELQNGGPRALGEAWIMTFWLGQEKAGREGNIPYIPGHPWMQGFPITKPAFGSI